jgi:glucosylceramidase
VNVVSKNSGKCLDITGGPTATSNGVPAQQWTCIGGTNQAFELTPVSGGYKITVQSSHRQLDIRGGPSVITNGTIIQQWAYWGAQNEIFSVAPTSDGYFTIRPLSSGSCLDVRGDSQTNGAVVQQWSCTGGDNQKWSFVPAS